MASSLIQPLQRRFGENYQKKGEHWASSVKKKTWTRRGGLASSHNCTVNNQVTMNKLWNWNFGGQSLGSKLKRFYFIISTIFQLQKFRDSIQRAQKSWGRSTWKCSNSYWRWILLLILVEVCFSKACWSRLSTQKSNISLRTLNKS